MLLPRGCDSLLVLHGERLELGLTGCFGSASRSAFHSSLWSS
jgi:hypothetical protein